MAYLGVYISVLRWSIFLRNYDIVVGKLKLCSIYSISTFFNNFLPTTIGGDAYKIIHLGKKIKNKKKEIVSSIILERGSGFFSLFLINFILVLFFYKLIIFDKIFIILEVFILLFFVIILLFIFQYPFLIKLKNKIIKKEILIINKFHNLMISLVNIKNKKTIFYGFCYSMVFLLLIALAKYILFYAFGLQINFYYILLVSSIIQIVGILPISLNSIGITESLNVFLFSLINVPSEISLAVALIGRISLIITSSLGGLFYFFDRRIEF